MNSQREYDYAKLERTKAEQERARKEDELQKLKEIALKEQHDLNEKRSKTLVEDFLRMKALTVRIKTSILLQNEIYSFYFSLDFTKTFFCLAACCIRTTFTNGSGSCISRLEIIISV